MRAFARTSHTPGSHRAECAGPPLSEGPRCATFRRIRGARNLPATSIVQYVVNIEGTYWTRTDLKRQGLTDYAIRKLHGEGKLHRLAQGLYMRNVPSGLEMLRGLYHRYPDLVFTGHTASAVYGQRAIVNLPAQATVPVKHRPLGTRYVEAVRSRRHRQSFFNGLPVVTPAAAVAGDIHLLQLERIKFLERQYDGLNGKERFTADYRALTPSQRDELTPLLKKSVIGASSRMERFFHLDLRRSGLDAIPNFRFGPYTWDVGIADGSTLVDLDSMRYHSSENERTFIVDRWKANHAETAGWGHLQFTDLCLADSQARKSAIDEIRRLVEHRRSVSPMPPVPGRIAQGIWTIHGQLRD